jgi:hypothetical protein
MLSEYSKGGLTIQILDWYGPVNNCYLKANVILNNYVTEDDIRGPILKEVLRIASDIGFKIAKGDQQMNHPYKYYAEAYYGLIV